MRIVLLASGLGETFAVTEIVLEEK